MLAFKFSDINRFEECRLHSIILITEGNGKGSLGNHPCQAALTCSHLTPTLSAERDTSAIATPHNTGSVWRMFVFFPLSHWCEFFTLFFTRTNPVGLVCLSPILGLGLSFSFFFFFNFYLLFIYYLFFAVLGLSVRGLSLVAASGGHSSSWCMGLSLSRPLLLRSTRSRRAGSVVVAHGPSCSAACGVLPYQGSNPCPPCWQADSQPLRHQGSPVFYFLKGNWMRIMLVITKHRFSRFSVAAMQERLKSINNLNLNFNLLL